jgi:hypothetical protein
MIPHHTYEYAIPLDLTKREHRSNFVVRQENYKKITYVTGRNNISFQIYSCQYYVAVHRTKPIPNQGGYVSVLHIKYTNQVC